MAEIKAGWNTVHSALGPRAAGSLRRWPGAGSQSPASAEAAEGVERAAREESLARAQAASAGMCISS